MALVLSAQTGLGGCEVLRDAIIVDFDLIMDFVDTKRSIE